MWLIIFHSFLHCMHVKLTAEYLTRNLYLQICIINDPINICWEVFNSNNIHYQHWKRRLDSYWKIWSRTSLHDNSHQWPGQGLTWVSTIPPNHTGPLTNEKLSFVITVKFNNCSHGQHLDGLASSGRWPSIVLCICGLNPRPHVFICWITFQFQEF